MLLANLGLHFLKPDKAVDVSISDVRFELAKPGVELRAADGTLATIKEGMGMLEISSTSTAEALLVMGFVAFLLALHFVGLNKLRQLFGSFVRAEPFAPSNVGALRTIGWVMVLAELVASVFMFALSSAIAMRFSGDGATLKPTFDLDVESLFVGLFLFILAEIFRAAGHLEEETALTV